MLKLMDLELRMMQHLKVGLSLIEGEYAFFKFEKFYDRLKSKDWKYKEEKTGRIMQHTYTENVRYSF